MSDFDEQARAAGERARQRADEIAATVDPAARTGTGTIRHSNDRRGRLVAAAAAVLVVVGGLAGLVKLTDSDRTEVDGTATTSVPMTADTPATTASTTASATSAPTAVEPPATATTEPSPEPITRPVVDPAICTTFAATSGEPSGLPRDPSSGLPLTLFAQPSELPIPIQVIGDPVDGQAEPFALVLRFYDRAPRLGAEATTDINGTPTVVRDWGNRNGEAEWTLPDGSLGYLRSRDLTREQIISILERLTPRDDDAAVNGFDYTPADDRFELVAERMNTDPRSGEGAGSQCRVESTGWIYRVYTISAPDVLPFASVIDRPVPLDVGVVGDQVVIVSGPQDPSAPRAADVVDTDEETWRQLLIAPQPEFAFAQPIGGDRKVVVEFVPIGDTATPVSWLTLRLDARDGVAVLEVYQRDAVIADAAEFWKTEIDGRVRGRSSAIPGEGQGVTGQRLGDSPEYERLVDEFTVRISTTDGDDQTIQTTGEVRLAPIAP